ncbi:TPA: hypothetical protein L3H17_002966 [Morganella morganii]|nr:hypothetical protein [Morganella morganii]
MKKILARIELYGADETDYESLHEKMRALGFARKIPHGDGTYDRLPDGTYVAEKDYDLFAIRGKISGIADQLSRKHNASVFVCSFTDSAWYLYLARDY